MEIFIFAAILGVTFALIKKVKESVHNTKERKRLKELENFLSDKETAFKDNFCEGRIWLADFIAEGKMHLDTELQNYLRTKKHPAKKGSEVVAQIKREKREITSKLKFLEYQLKSYEEYFPFLEEFKEIILDERADLSSFQDNIATIESVDPVNKFLSKKEYEKLSTSKKNQLALDRYVEKNKSKWEIGIFYERYLGYLMESDGWKVIYQGAIKGFEDFGRDLICSKEGKYRIIQAKCWSKNKVIHEKHIFQLYATCIHFTIENPNAFVLPVFTTTTDLSDPAKLVADNLNIEINSIECPKLYPMIKCNINRTTKEKIYHLPFDQQYDRIYIEKNRGECYVETVKQAEKLGFRRAFKYNFNKDELAL